MNFNANIKQTNKYGHFKFTHQLIQGTKTPNGLNHTHIHTFQHIHSHNLLFIAQNVQAKVPTHTDFAVEYNV